MPRASLEPRLNTGRGVIADAWHSTHETTRYTLDSGLHYLPIAKGSQPTLPEQSCDGSHRTAVARSESGLGHGRIARRAIQVSTDPGRQCPRSRFPGVRFARRRAREAIDETPGEVRSTQIVYQLTSLQPELCPAGAPAALVAGVLEDRELRASRARHGAARGRLLGVQRIPSADHGGVRQARDLGAAATGQAEHEARHGRFQAAS